MDNDRIQLLILIDSYRSLLFRLIASAVSSIHIVSATEIAFSVRIPDSLPHPPGAASFCAVIADRATPLEFLPVGLVAWRQL